MKQQDIYKNDSTTIDSDKLFISNGIDSCINHPCIMTHDQILTKGKIYLLLNGFSSEGLYYSVVKFIDSINKNNVISIILEEVHNETMFKVQIDIKETINHFKWMLLDLSNLQSMVEKIEVYDFCLAGNG